MFSESDTGHSLGERAGQLARGEYRERSIETQFATRGDCEIPRYQRHAPPFEAVMRTSPADVIVAMDAAGDDIPYQCPSVRLPLPSVGVNRKHVPLLMADPFGGTAPCRLECNVAVRCFVPAEKRGIHTSRIGRAVAETSTEPYASMQEYATELARRVYLSEYGVRAEVRVSGTLSYVEHVHGWKSEKEKSSLEHLGLHAATVMEGNDQYQTVGLTINHITACPCVQQTYRHALLSAKGNVSAAVREVAPLLTHSQRCRTRVEFSGLTETLSLRRLLECVDGTVYRVQNTLPREHELLLVYRAHRSPQFIEDAVRQILQAVHGRFATVLPNATVRVQSLSFESIHDYDIVAEIELPMAELGRLGQERP